MSAASQFAASHEVFISYSRKDERVADAIHRALQSKQIECWIDRQEIKPGSTWSQEIINAIDASKVMVLVFSGHVNKSHVIPAEVHQAFSRQMPIVVVRIAAVEPGAALRLELSRSQWLDARPFTKHALRTVVSSVEHLLHHAEPIAVAPSLYDRCLKTVVQSFDLLMGRRGYGAAPGGRVAEASPPRPVADGEAVDLLVQQHRWHAIKELIEAREMKNVPLRDLAQLKPELAKKLDAFERARTRVLTLIEHVGPEAVEDDLAKLQQVISDHPGLGELKATTLQFREELAELRRVLDRCAREDRWVAAENEIRGVAHRCRMANQSLLRAAETASTKSEQIMNRFDLVTWFALVGAAVMVCVALTQHVFQGGDSRGEFGGALALLAAFMTAAVVPAVCLGLYGRRPSATTVVLGPLFATVAVILDVLLRVVSGQLPSEQWPLMVRESACAVLLMLVMLMPTADLISPKMKPPAFAAVLCACVLAGVQLPSTHVLHHLTVYLPAALITSTLLAVTGSIRSMRGWLMVPLAALLAGYGVYQSNPEPWVQASSLSLGVACMFVVAAVLACGRTTRGGYLWVLFATAGGLGLTMLPSMRNTTGECVPTPLLLVAVWAAAVGGAALSYRHRLGRLQVFDCLRKRLSERLAFAGTRVSEPRLTDTEWYRAGMAWHAKRDRRERQARSDSGVAGR